MSLFAASDVAKFRAGAFAAVCATYFAGVNYGDDYLLGEILAAEQDIKAQLKVLLEPTVIFPVMPSQDDIDALNGKPWLDEPGYDYDPEFFRNERWGFIVSRQHPIISIEYIQFAYPAPTTQIYRIPSDWLRVDRKYGHIRMVPATSTFVAPLGAFLMQALGGGSNVPSMIQMKYTAGLNGTNDPLFPLIKDVIFKKAVLKVMENAMLPASSSISADGLSESLSVKIEDHQAAIDRTLFGPKGSNGGLWAAIHGIQSSVLGAV